MEFESGRAEMATRCGTLSYVAVGGGPPAVFVPGVATNACCRHRGAVHDRWSTIAATERARRHG